MIERNGDKFFLCLLNGLIENFFAQPSAQRNEWRSTIELTVDLFFKFEELGNVDTAHMLTQYA